eukprot:m.122902 g.122902  ORF g.122902 m.122902 type:complete len:75 (+) comp13439_c0_seq5:128-352(+)
MMTRQKTRISAHPCLFGLLVVTQPVQGVFEETESTTIFCTVAAVVLLILGIGLAYARSCLCFRPFRIDERGNIF